MKYLRLTTVVLLASVAGVLHAQNVEAPGRPQYCSTTDSTVGDFQVNDPAMVLTTPNSDFADVGDGTVTHIPTGLTWKRCAEGMTWNGATKTCDGTASGYSFDGLRGGLGSIFVQVDAVNANQAGTQNLGYTDWRVPNIKELASIVEWGCFPQRLNFKQFPRNPANNVTGIGGSYWSSSPYSGSTNYFGKEAAYSLIWDSNQDGGYRSDYPAYLRLVRGGPALQNFDAAAIPPTLAGSPPTGIVAQAYAGFTPTTGPSNVTLAVSYAITAGSLPPGLLFDPATAAITGTPTQAGSFPITITATNVGGSASLPVVIQVDAPPTLAGSPPEGMVGQAYAGFTPTTGPSDVTRPVTYAITAGSLPPGLVFDPATGAITGTPTQAGSFPITITATNSAGHADLPVVIKIGTVPVPPVPQPPAPVPTLGEWSLWLAALMLGGVAAPRLRRRRRG